MRLTLLSSLLIMLRIAVYAYVVVLVTWLAIRPFYGDYWWWLFLLNAGALYLFLPVPWMVLGALLLRRVDLWLISGAALGLGLYLYGGLFLTPLRPAPVRRNDPTLVVMTYNVLGHKVNIDAMVASLRASDADIIALQELGTPLAEAIQKQLSEDYPYQILEPKRTNDGMGVISRYRLEATDAQLPGRWLGKPQVLHVEFAGSQITFVNIHCISISLSTFAWQQNIERAARERERQAQTLADVAERRSTPLIVVGDFNTTDQTMAYRLLTRLLHDAWREGGFGFGHTFPGPYAPFGAVSSGEHWPVTLWLARIDYIFHSDEWYTRAAQTGPEGGHSDHRPVVATLALRTPAVLSP